MAEFIDEIDDSEEVSDGQLLDEVGVFGDLLTSIENSGLNMLPTEKLELQIRLLKLINQRLDFLDYEVD